MGGRYFPTRGSQIMFCRLRLGSDMYTGNQCHRQFWKSTNVSTDNSGTRRSANQQTREDTPLQIYREWHNNAVLFTFVQFNVIIIFLNVEVEISFRSLVSC